MTLEDRWLATWRDLDLVPPDEALAALLARHAEPHRAYHVARHLEECFAQLELARSAAERPGEVALALWYHDAVHDTRRHDNEERSAALAREVLEAAGAAGETASRVEALILATRHDGRPPTRDAELVVDVDLSILGADAARFDEYEVQVRSEYDWVPEPAFREARARLLRAFLAREHVYLTASFRERLESRARANLARSLARLSP
jgi:predicted metal-dependent HD superfamily phosphohydrolase